MVVDTIANARIYAGLGGRIAKALTLLGKEDFRAQEVGKHEVEGASLFYLVQSYTTKREDEAAWESHRTYLDVQYVVEGTERFGWAPVSALKVTRPYDAATDAALYAGSGNFVTAGPGTFLLLWPDDAHMPGIAAGPGAGPADAGGAPSKVLKVVVKVLL